MPYDGNGLEIISAAARIHEEDHLRRCALELTKMEAPTRRPTPIRSGVTQAQLDKQIGDMLKRMGEILVEHFATIRKRLEELEAKRWGSIAAPGRRAATTSPWQFRHRLRLAVALQGGYRHAARHLPRSLDARREEGT